MSRTKKNDCGSEEGQFLPDAVFDPSSVRAGRPRQSRMGRRRALVLVLIHVAAFAHILHWQLAGRTMSPLEPSETMYTLRDGLVNAGAILMALSTLSVLILGRFFCGWACHLVALQDLCAWMLKKIGIRPRPLRSRFLVFVPLGAALVMFGMPLVYRYREELGLPEFENGLAKTEFWETFPGFWVGLLTFLFCGFIMVWLLGSKGFCTYACPYGGIFGVADRVAPGRIRVNDDCRACGHCTAVCTSNVAVAQEVHQFGMVVDPGCMKCMDCVSVCPENALSFGFGKPAVLAAPRRGEKKKRRFDFSLTQDLSMVLVFAAALAVFAGLPDTFVPWAASYQGSTPLLFALGLAAATAFLVGLVWRAFGSEPLVITGLRIRGKSGLTGRGRIFLVLSAVWLLFCLQVAFVQVNFFRAESRFQLIDVPTYAWLPKGSARPQEVRTLAEEARAAYERARRFGLLDDLRIPSRLAAIAMVEGRPHDAIEEFEKAKAIAPDHPETRRELASVHAHVGQVLEAIREGKVAAELDPHDHAIRFAVMKWAIISEDWRSAMEMARQLLPDLPPARAATLELDMVGFEFNLGHLQSARARAESLRETLAGNARLKAYLEAIEAAEAN